MVNFAELKAKAEKVKDAGITKVTNTRDRFSSAPTSKTNWDPNWKRAPPPAPSAPAAGTGRARIPTSGPPPPPPPRSRSGVVVSGADTAPPPVPRASRPTDDSPEPPPYTLPPGRRETSGDGDGVEKIDWANLGSEDKEEFFGWLDEFFSQHLGIELSGRERRPAPLSGSATFPAHGRLPPAVNNATRPRA